MLKILNLTLKPYRVLTATLALMFVFTVVPHARAQKARTIPAPRTTTPRAPQLGGKSSDIPVALAIAVQQEKLIAPDGATNDFFGTSVAISGDTAIIGASGDEPADDAGSAYVFVRSGTTWTMQQKLTASDAAANDFFGTSVAISGNTVVVGANSDDSPNTDAGSAYVFVRNGTTWTQQQKLTAADQMPSDQFGISVAINGDTVMVGAEQSNSPVSNTGAVYVFTRTNTTWTQQQKLTASDAAEEDRFGFSVGISGETAVVGAYGDDFFTGSAYVFVRNGATWAEQQKLVASDRASIDWFGNAVAVDGNTVVVGARFQARFNASEDGAAYVFVRNGTSWMQQQKLPNPEPSHDEEDPDLFGNAVAVRGDTIVVGANGDVEDLILQPGTDSGSAYVFIRSDTTWTLQQKLVGAPGVSTGESFGSSAAIGNDGTIIIGAAFDDRIHINAGSAYVYTSKEVAATLPGQLIISEFRARGPDGESDAFVELYNNTDSAIVVAPTDNSSGFALVSSNGVVCFVVPTGTVIPARGHLLVGNVFHSLTAYADKDLSPFSHIPINVGLALFNTSTPANFTLANRLDAVGPSSEANPLYREGAGYVPVNVVDTQYSLVRDLSAARPKDTQDNQADFRVVGPVTVRADATYGYPGPENLASPIERSALFPMSLLDPAQSASAAPNRVRDFSTATPCSNFGTLSIRRTVTNNTGAAVTRLRFRVVIITTAPAPAGTADLRPISSGTVVETVGGSPRTIMGTTLENAGGALPNNCGGLNSSLSVATVTSFAQPAFAAWNEIKLGAPLAAGGAVDVQFLLGVQQPGTFRFFVIVEALP